MPRARSTSRSVTMTSSIALPRNSPATCSNFCASAGVVRSARAAISAFTSPSTCALTDSRCTSRRASSAASLLSSILVLPFFFQFTAQFVTGFPVLRVLFGVQPGLDALFELRRLHVHVLFVFTHQWLPLKTEYTFGERREGPGQRRPHSCQPRFLAGFGRNPRRFCGLLEEGGLFL